MIMDFIAQSLMKIRQILKETIAWYEADPSPLDTT